MNIDHPTLFDDILGTPVPTLHRAGAEQRDALAAAQSDAAHDARIAELAARPHVYTERDVREVQDVRRIDRAAAVAVLRAAGMVPA